MDDDRENQENSEGPEGVESTPRESRGREGSYSTFSDRQKAAPMEVLVEHNIEKAMKILKRKLIKEGLFKELKSRRYFEKPSEKKKRKGKESMKKIRKEEARSKKNPYF